MGSWQFPVFWVVVFAISLGFVAQSWFVAFAGFVLGMLTITITIVSMFTDKANERLFSDQKPPPPADPLVWEGD